MTELETARKGAEAGAAVTVMLIDREPQARQVVRVLAEIWPRADGKEPLPAELAWVFAHSGNYVALATVRGEAVGAAIAFRGEDPEGPHLHSHIAGVVPRWQGSNVGYTLKQHQRTWALGQGLRRITWTFDPLVARNAYFNVVKLGARLTRYYVDFYGPMDDGINVGDETDRALATWSLASDAAVAAAEGRFVPGDVAAARSAGAVHALRRADDGRPVVIATDAPTRLLALPRDIVDVRQHQPEVAREWRLALRQALVAAFADGLEVVGVTRDSVYLLECT